MKLNVSNEIEFHNRFFEDLLRYRINFLAFVEQDTLRKIVNFLEEFEFSDIEEVYENEFDETLDNIYFSQNHVLIDFYDSDVDPTLLILPSFVSFASLKYNIKEEVVKIKDEVESEIDNFIKIIKELRKNAIEVNQTEDEKIKKIIEKIRDEVQSEIVKQLKAILPPEAEFPAPSSF